MDACADDMCETGIQNLIDYIAINDSSSGCNLLSNLYKRSPYSSHWGHGDMVGNYEYYMQKAAYMEVLSHLAIQVHSTYVTLSNADNLMWGKIRDKYQGMFSKSLTSSSGAFAYGLSKMWRNMIKNTETLLNNKEYDELYFTTDTVSALLMIEGQQDWQLKEVKTNTSLEI